MPFPNGPTSFQRLSKCAACGRVSTPGRAAWRLCRNKTINPNERDCLLGWTVYQLCIVPDRRRLTLPFLHERLQLGLCCLMEIGRDRRFDDLAVADGEPAASYAVDAICEDDLGLACPERISPRTALADLIFTGFPFPAWLRLVYSNEIGKSRLGWPHRGLS